MLAVEDAHDSALQAHVSRLRRKLGPDAAHLQTVLGDRLSTPPHHDLDGCHDGPGALVSPLARKVAKLSRAILGLQFVAVLGIQFALGRILRGEVVRQIARGLEDAGALQRCTERPGPWPYPILEARSGGIGALAALRILLVLFSAFALVALTAVPLVRRIRTLSQAMTHVVDADFEGSVADEAPDDELGEVARAFDQAPRTTRLSSSGRLQIGPSSKRLPPTAAWSRSDTRTARCSFCRTASCQVRTPTAE